MDSGESRVIANGIISHGVRWIIDAGGNDSDYWTGMRIVGPGELSNSGGMAGPKLWGTDVLNTYSARYDEGPLELAILVRADPSVRCVMLCSASGVDSSLTACGDGVIDGLRFYVGFAEPQSTSSMRKFGLSELRGLDGNGETLETYDLSFWDRMDRV